MYTDTTQFYHVWCLSILSYVCIINFSYTVACIYRLYLRILQYVAIWNNIIDAAILSLWYNQMHIDSFVISQE